MAKDVKQFDIIEYLTLHGTKIAIVIDKYPRNYYYAKFHDGSGIKISSTNFDIIDNIYCPSCSAVFKKKIKCPSCGYTHLISLEELERSQENANK